MSEESLILSEMSVTHFYQNRSSVLNSILTGKNGVVFTRYSRPVAILIPVPDEIRRRLDPRDEAGDVIPFSNNDHPSADHGLIHGVHLEENTGS